MTGLAPGQPAYRILITEDRDSNQKLILSEGCDDFVRKPFVEESI